MKMIPFLLLLAGCATNPNLTPEQIKAMVADKASTAVCVTIVAPAGTTKIVFVNLDETRVNGTVNVDPASCGVNMTTTSPPKTTTPPKVTP